MEKLVKLQKQTKEGTISMTLPKFYCEFLKWNVGDSVKVVLDGERIIIEKDGEIH